LENIWTRIKVWTQNKHKSKTQNKHESNQGGRAGGLAGAGTPIECNEYEEESPPPKKVIVE